MRKRKKKKRGDLVISHLKDHNSPLGSIIKLTSYDYEINDQAVDFYASMGSLKLQNCTGNCV